MGVASEVDVVSMRVAEGETVSSLGEERAFNPAFNSLLPGNTQTS